ncbi:16972_t:CDS:2, partial [Acaulospora colombiana]
SELELEDFLPPDDKRKQETEYAKAQEWDQLRRIMKSLGTNVFTGFQEAPINFPPTFKYDVLRTLKGSKRVRKDARMRGKILSEVEEVTHHEAESSTMDITLKENTSAIAEDDDSSSTSSASISIQSRSAVDNDDEASLNGSDAGAKNGGSNTTPYPDLERTAKHAVHVARRRWWTVFRSTVSLPTPEQLSSKKAAHKAKSPSIGSKSGSIGPASAQEKVLITPVQAGNPTTTSVFTKSDLTLDNKALKLPQPPANVRASTSLDIPLRPSNDGPSSVMMTRSITSKTSSSAPGISRALIGEASVDVEDKGVYDTSSKRRVPSWCDRILYKSTITLPLSPALETPTVELGLTTIPVESPPVSRRNTPKIGTFFHALKSKKRSSTGQSSSTQIVNSPSTTSKQTTMSTNIESTNPNEPTGMSTANIPALARLANEAGEAESPTSIPTTPQPYQATDKMSRRITSPIMARNDSSASTAVRATHNRRRSLSATIPRPNEPIELIGRPLPASASTPPVLPLAFSDGPPSANDATLNKDGSLPSGGSFRGLRRFLSFLPGSFSAAPTPPASAAPPTEEPLAVHGPPLKIFRKGEIRYLEYNTLSDKEMRQLEGRITGTTSGLNSGGKSGGSSPNIPAIVGGVVGGTLGLIAIIALVWYLLWRREQMKDLFDDDEDEDTSHGLKPRGVMMRDGRRGRRSLNLDDEVKSETNHPYQYGMVGSISPSPKPGMHSQQSSLGYQHRRSGSRDALMRSGAPSPPSVSPNRLSAHLPSTGSQGRASYNSNMRPDSVMMAQPMNPHQQWTSEDTPWTQPPRPSSSLLEAPNVYPPGHNGFYQQYGPMESIPSQTQVNLGQANNAQPAIAHQALYEAAGLGTASPPTSSSVPVTALPPPGAGGARPFTEWRASDIQSAVMAGADRAAASVSPPPNTSGSENVGFGRQRVEKSPRAERVTSPVVQHQDAGRVPDTQSNPTASNANANSDAPPAYSQS